ncbi:hypothetical protein CABS01_09667 [Colletotrichum abscissum]|uniref:uncharacterized protein n=1 Tax=Colletotrichum abscissum TaxID=1671311 RepID=UPI0027D7276F|nr:uncharacterized protein CABS01_09667 [Colletotrichum abscissum]KAK1501936.1 hypothetical protein CABS01_09667 [Colletotrichum abscissum]
MSLAFSHLQVSDPQDVVFSSRVLHPVRDLDTWTIALDTNKVPETPGQPSLLFTALVLVASKDRIRRRVAHQCAKLVMNCSGKRNPGRGCWSLGRGSKLPPGPPIALL